MAFESYLRFIESHGEGIDPETPRASWKDQLIAGSVVELAATGLTRLASPNFPVDIVSPSPGLIRTARPILLGDCRLTVLGGLSPESDLAELARIAGDSSRESLVLVVLPSNVMELPAPTRPAGERFWPGIIPVYPVDVDALANGGVSIEQLIDYKLVRLVWLGSASGASQYAPRLFREHGCGGDNVGPFAAIEDVLRQRGERLSDWTEHPSTSSLVREFDLYSRSSLLVGDSSSGKTVLSIQVGSRLENQGWSVRYLNLSDAHGPPGGIAQDLLFGATRDEPSKLEVDPGPVKSLLILDDLQSNPRLAALLLSACSLRSRCAEVRSSATLAVSWREYSRDVLAYAPDLAPKPISAASVRERLLEQYETTVDRAVLDSLAGELGDDILLLRLALDLAREHSSPVNRSEVAEDLWNQRVPGEQSGELLQAARRVALLVGSVGQFDIHLPLDFVQRVAGVSSARTDQLISSRLLRRFGSHVTLGHRSLCALVAGWLADDGAWAELVRVGGPKDVGETMLRLLEAVPAGEAVDALRSLIARAGFRDRAGLGSRAQVIVQIWTAFVAVVERVEDQQLRDPTWNRTPSSAMFVSTLFSEIGKPQLAAPSIAFLREHWAVDGDDLQIQTSGLSTVVDFDQLLGTMRAAGDEPGWELAGAVDVDRFHRTWLAGLILGAEAAAAVPGTVGLDRIAAAVEKQALDSGAFYPERAPWSTARVLLGLVACGRTMANSRTVERAVEWLLRERPHGGATEAGTWASGTGTWNTDVETTALVLLALIRSGVDADDIRLARAKDFLLERRNEWAGFDGAVAIESLLSAGVPWMEVAPETAALCEWAMDATTWSLATLPADTLLTQTCHVAQASTHLIEIGWNAIRSDLNDLLSALDLPPSGGESRALATASDDVTTAIEPSAGRNDLLELLRDLNEIDLPRYAVVGACLRWDERARRDLEDRCDSIRRAVLGRTNQHENWLIWAAPGSGKSFMIQQLGASLSDEGCEYVELNLAGLPKDEFLNGLQGVATSSNPVLCMIDEVDGRSSEDWPYEDLFATLSVNTTTPDRQVAFVLVGSSMHGLHGMVRGMMDRSKGRDLVDRVPDNHRFELPPAVLMDRVLVFAQQALRAASRRGSKIAAIDKLALYYVLASSGLQSPRQIGELAQRAVRRMEEGASRLTFTDLFEPGMTEHLRFAVEHLDAFDALEWLAVQVS